MGCRGCFNGILLLLYHIMKISRSKILIHFTTLRQHLLKQTKLRCSFYASPLSKRARRTRERLNMPSYSQRFGQRVFRYTAFAAAGSNASDGFVSNDPAWRGYMEDSKTNRSFGPDLPLKEALENERQCILIAESV